MVSFFLLLSCSGIKCQIELEHFSSCQIQGNTCICSRRYRELQDLNLVRELCSGGTVSVYVVLHVLL